MPEVKSTDALTKQLNDAYASGGLQAYNAVLSRPKVTEPTGSVSFNPDGSRTVTPPSVVDNYWNQNSPDATKETFNSSQNTTKQDFQQRMQDAINSVDSMYASVIARANQQGANNLGSTNVVNALSGQRGSASGAANVDKTLSANKATLDTIDREKQAKVAEITGTYTKNLQTELQHQNELRQADTQKWLEYMGGKESENKLQSKQMRADLLNANIDIADIAPEELKQMAEAHGYSVDQFKTLYNAEKQTKDKAFADTELQRISELETERLQNEKMTLDNAQTKAENANLATKDEKDLILKGYRPISKPDQLKKLTESDIVRMPDGKIYAKPNPDEKTIAELQKKYPDAKISSRDDMATAQLKIENNSAIYKKAVLVKTKTGGSGSSNTDKNLYGQVKEKLSAVVGGDGYVSPKDYTFWRASYIAEGGNPTYFDTQAKGFRNPNNPNYVTDKKKEANKLF